MDKEKRKINFPAIDERQQETIIGKYTIRNSNIRLQVKNTFLL